MSCIQSLSGLIDDCSQNFVGGASRQIYLINRQSGISLTQSGGVVTALTDGSGNALTSSDVKGYDFRKNSASLTSTLQTGDVEYFESAITGTFVGLSSAKFAELSEVLKDAVAAIIVDNNGTAWIIGVESGADVTNLVATTGTAKTDANQIECTLTAYEAHLPYALDDTLKTSLNIG